jgi:hypothetical protein
MIRQPPFGCFDFTSRRLLGLLRERMQEQDAPVSYGHIQDSMLDLAAYAKFPEVRSGEMTRMWHA